LTGTPNLTVRWKLNKKGLLMLIKSVAFDDLTIVVHWEGGEETLLPCLWLRDNDLGAFHPDTHERTFDLLSVDASIKPQDIRVDDTGDNLIVRWPDLDKDSTYPAAWLQTCQPGRIRIDSSAIQPIMWKTANFDELPRHAANQVLSDRKSMLAFLKDVTSFGITIVEGLDASESAGLAIGEMIGPMRNSNFGPIFDVISKPDPNNLAYTSGHLPLHTDLPNQETPPAYQFLHCIVNDADGGESLYCDGFQVADDLRVHQPIMFELLANTPIPFRFHDGQTDIRRHRPVITLDETGAVSMIAWNAHLADSFDMDVHLVADYYDAYRTFMAMVRDPAYVASVKLTAGEMVVFDNRRVLHGRAEFFPNTGNRHLKGYYIDRVDMMSRIRLLSA
jgi:gamma-butyrobetaine dioxygenase